MKYSLMHRVRKREGANDTLQYTITVPVKVARMVSDAGIKAFTVSLTEEGILYRPVRTEPEATPLVPQWLRKESA